MPDRNLNLAVLVSGSGTTLQNLIDKITAGELAARISVVIGSRQGLKGIERARAAGLASHVVDRRSYDSTQAFSREVFELCDDAGADLVCLAGWLCLLEMPAAYRERVMNIHPALLPSFGGKGMYGARVHEAVIEHGCKVSGCTVHFVDAAYDTGPIIIQRTCPVLDSDSPAALAERVFAQEMIAYPDAIRLFQAGRLQVDGLRVHIRPA